MARMGGWVGAARARAQRACRSVWRVGGEEEEKRGGREERRKRREEGEEEEERRGFAREARRRRTLRPFSEAYRAVVSMGVSGG